MILKEFNLKYKIIKKNNNYICLKIDNKLLGFSSIALTIGNSLRRVLLNNLMGTKITSFNVKSSNLDLIALEGLKEDLFEIISNFKKIVLRSNKIKKSNGILSIKGPGIVTAADIIFDKNLTLINPNQYLFTITKNSLIEFDFIIEQGFGYKFFDEKNIKTSNLITSKFIDANFSPVTKVNYKTTISNMDINKNIINENVYNNNNNNNNIITESLFLEIWTDGSITPLRAFAESNKVLSTLFLSLLK